MVGDTYPLGCPFSDRVVYGEFFENNPDLSRSEFQRPCGIYQEGLGLENVVMSWGHDEYMYQVCKPYLPEEALYMIRYHSFYAAHQEDAYTWLMDDHDKLMFDCVRQFQPYDLYSKADAPPDTDALKPYYCDLIAKYFPTQIAF